MPLIIDPTKYIIGAADVYYRAIALRSGGPWTSIGATTGNVALRVGQKVINPSDTFNGVLQPILGMDYLSDQSAEVDFMMPGWAGAALAVAVLGAVSSIPLPITDQASPAYTATTLAAAAAAGDSNIKVTAVAGAAAGQWIRIDVTGALAEYRQIDVVGTLGAGGTGISFRNPLRQAHASGVAVVQSQGDGKTEIVAGVTRRQPNTAYNDWALVAQSPTDYYELLIYNGISMTPSSDMTLGQDTMASIAVTIASRLDGSNLALPAWKLRTP